MSEARNPGDHGGHNDPEFRVGRGKPARRRLAAFGVGIVVFVFAVLLAIWLWGSYAADAQSAAGGHGSAPESGGPVASLGSGHVPERATSEPRTPVSQPGHLLPIE